MAAMKYLIGFVLGVLLTVLAYEPDTATEMPTELIAYA
jgi:heme/copper-type cytochrome/quinol oxidase subunit 4